MENKLSLATLQVAEQFKIQLIHEVENKLKISVGPESLNRTKIGKKWHIKLQKDDTGVKKTSVAKIRIPKKDYEVPKSIKNDKIKSKQR